MENDQDGHCDFKVNFLIWEFNLKQLQREGWDVVANC